MVRRIRGRLVFHTGAGAQSMPTAMAVISGKMTSRSPSRVARTTMRVAVRAVRAREGQVRGWFMGAVTPV